MVWWVIQEQGFVGRGSLGAGLRAGNGVWRRVCGVIEVVGCGEGGWEKEEGRRKCCQGVEGAWGWVSSWQGARGG